MVDIDSVGSGKVENFIINWNIVHEEIIRSHLRIIQRRQFIEKVRIKSNVRVQIPRLRRLHRPKVASQN